MSVALTGILSTGFVVIVLENTNRGTTFGDPYFLNLTNMGMYLGNYHGKQAQPFIYSPPYTDQH